MKNQLKSLSLLCVSFVLAGCAGMNYNSKISAVTNGLQTRQINQSLAELDSSHTSEDSKKDLLYLMERGELLSLDGKIEDSKATFLKADSIVKDWEETAKHDSEKLLGNIGSFTVNDSTRPYEGRDYEKVLLNIELAMNHAVTGNWDNSRIEITKMHERQSIIAEFRSKELDKAKEAAKGKGIKTTSFKELNGYPIQALEAPEVQGLKNAYESAFGNYLAGFVFESLGEGSLAAPGYRKAIEMRPGTPQLESSLKGLDGRIRSNRMKKSGNEVDTLLVVETGLAPPIISQQIGLMLPVPCSNSGICPTLVQLSWPVIGSTNNTLTPSTLNIDGKDESLIFMTSIDAMAKKALYDEMPGIIARTTIRAIAKTAAQKAVDNSSTLQNALGPFAGLASLATKVAVAATEVADERSWRTLPRDYSIVRLKLSPGKHTINLPTKNGAATVDISVTGKHALVPLRVVGDNLYIVQSDGSPATVKFAADKVASAANSETVASNSAAAAPVTASKAPTGTTAAKSTNAKATVFSF